MIEDNKGLQLQFIKEKNCPICGTHIVVEESVDVDRFGREPKIREHVHGGKWEHRRFICGMTLSYCPNFQKTEVNKYSNCKNNPVLIERIKKREEAKQKVLMFIDEIYDVDEDFKKKMHEEVRRISI
ncbi:hypothetical protein ACFVS2_25880 [Brevibacillus sp. NPDC058079]|uniref:hypothetical protein n=1 Tax=Brevibacillus sp. NPDC058079 TaxID=3346330 RepID=UPI0036E8239B